MKHFLENPTGYMKGKSYKQINKLVWYTAYKKKAHFRCNDPAKLTSYNFELLSYVPVMFRCSMYDQGWKPQL